MNNYEIDLEENYKSLRIHEMSVVFTDIDSIFKESNIQFSSLLHEMDLNVDFDFGKKYNKQLYTHTFLKVLCDYLKDQHINHMGYNVTFYSNTLTKDKFRNALLKKIKSTFKFNVFESIDDYTKIVEKLVSRDGELTPKLEIFFQKDNKPKSFQFIKKYMEKTGLKYMQDEYFQDIANKMTIL